MKSISYFALTVSVMFGVVLGNLGSELILRGLEPNARQAPTPAPAVAPAAPAVTAPPAVEAAPISQPSLPVVKLRPPEPPSEPPPAPPIAAAPADAESADMEVPPEPVAAIQWDDPESGADDRQLNCQRYRYLYENEPTEENADAVLEWCGRSSRRVAPKRVQPAASENR